MWWRSVILYLFMSGFTAPGMAFDFNFPDVNFPRQRTEDARQVRWVDEGQAFNAYFWWGKGYLWVEVEPLVGAAPRICKGSLWAVQNGNRCGRIFPLLDQPERISYCGAVPTPTIFMVMIQVIFPTCDVDPARNFTLTYNTPESDQRVLIFGNVYHRYDEVNEDNAGGGCWIRALREP